ncbi:UDP-N-acetylmuramoyl-tripeptide--D-alanyl-D-alanine ligase [Gynuella sunshinyii]|uniref:UDP-N-acetylmuramoyl-tripeptide--D-alanyl-D-alanine ligase n=1 Tax=Gynuella sunshinyii YC6258 TaxID=1445510 RepID=A0A0C5VID1_9GAMM|nr:UDP-N-acetylmuramoyl-tripeptide--D-alanyl-D-alanine ligase [Gynuella sunshinyii]AJQ94427.1 UDP-N-acetylmuramyl pentapeptide synthase [Gynuella sunshinyii YC6258]
MIRAFSLSELQQIIPGATLKGKDVAVTSISTDSRSLKAGETYLALKGLHFDGHQFVTQCIEKGAVAIVVEQPYDIDVAQLIVPDGLVALSLIAQLNRRLCTGKVLGLTGSAGKTSTKEMLLSVCSLRGNAIATQANLNNNIGVPFTLLRISRSTEFAIIEMGTNTPGEINFSSRCSEPDIGLILNASEQHYEGFGSLDAIREEKSDLLNGIPQGGTVILNADDGAYKGWSQKAREKSLKVISFAVKRNDADFTAEQLASDENGKFSFRLRAGKEAVRIALNVAGRHQVSNALACAAMAYTAGVNLATIQKGLEYFVGVTKRLEVLNGIRETCIYNDTYNASPASVYAGLDLMADIAGRTIAVLGDMAELGGESISLHKAISHYAERKADLVFFYGPQFASAAVHNVYLDKPELIRAVKAALRKGDRILVKGANCMKMQDVVNALIPESAQ